MLEKTGLELQRHLSRARILIPTIVITAHDEVSTRDRCQSAGDMLQRAHDLADRLGGDAGVEKVCGSAWQVTFVPYLVE
jgi:CheY-like chemotaxis protein